MFSTLFHPALQIFRLQFAKQLYVHRAVLISKVHKVLIHMMYDNLPSKHRHYDEIAPRVTTFCKAKCINNSGRMANANGQDLESRLDILMKSHKFHAAVQTFKHN